MGPKKVKTGKRQPGVPAPLPVQEHPAAEAPPSEMEEDTSFEAVDSDGQTALPMKPTTGKRLPGVPAPLPVQEQPEAEAPPSEMEDTSSEAVDSDGPTLIPDEEYEAASPPASGQSPSHESEEEPQNKKQPKKKKQKRHPKKNLGWSLSDEVEQGLIEWLQDNTYLWLRSTKDYHRKKAAWEQKAQELNITLKHLQNWWKNVKDWFVKLSKKTSGQATRVLTDRDRWILKNVAFYKRTMTADVPDTLGSLVRDQSLSAGSAGSALPVATSSQAQDPEITILEDMELEAAMQATATTTATRRNVHRKTPAQIHEETMVAKLATNLDANQQLLRQVLQEKAHPLDKKDAFLLYFEKYMRAATDQEFQDLQRLFYEAICRQMHTAPLQPSAAPPQPQPQPPPPPPPPPPTDPLMFSPSGFATPSPQWQPFGLLAPAQQQQQQQQLQTLSTPLRTRSRESAESFSRLLASTMEDMS